MAGGKVGADVEGPLCRSLGGARPLRAAAAAACVKLLLLLGSRWWWWWWSVPRLPPPLSSTSLNPSHLTLPPPLLSGISGGERKRLAFASEVLMDPSVLFVDEVRMCGLVGARPGMSGWVGG